MTKKNIIQRDPVDIFAGSKLRQLRKKKKLTQTELANKIPERLRVSYQQIQKYESGENKINLATLYHFAQLFKLKEGVSYFLNGYTEAKEVVQDISLSKETLQEAVIDYMVNNPKEIKDLMLQNSSILLKALLNKE